MSDNVIKSIDIDPKDNYEHTRIVCKCKPTVKKGWVIEVDGKYKLYMEQLEDSVEVELIFHKYLNRAAQRKINK